MRAFGRWSGASGVLLACSALLMAGGALAQSPPSACAAPEFRQFDFWVGEWSVTDSAGATPYGTSSVTNEEGGCVIHEHWQSAGGGTGQSFNFYNATRKDWTQVWVASSGGQLHLVGHLSGGAMVLDQSMVAPNGAPVVQRISWTPEPDGRVRQMWQQSRDGGKTWTVAFDGWYRRKG